MPTVIDSLVVLLRLDPQGQFRQDAQRVSGEQRKAKERALKDSGELETRFRQTADTMGKVRREILGVLTVFTAGAGLTQFAQNVITADAAVGRMSKQIGVATADLSAWQGVLKRSGGSADEATAGLGTIQKAFQDIQLTGQSPLIPYLRNLGIQLKDLEDPGETLLKIADQLAKMPAPRAAALGAGMGFSPAMISLLSKGRGEITKLLAEQRALGVTTDKDAEAAQRLQDKLEGLKSASARVGRNLLGSLAPAIETVTVWLQDLATWAQDNSAVVTAALSGLAFALGSLALEAALAAAPVVAIVAAFVALGAAISALVDDWEKWKSGGPSTFDWSGVQSLVDALSDTFDDLKDALDDVTTAWNEMTAAIPPEFWEYLRRGVQAVLVLLLTTVKSSIDGLVTSLKIVKDVIQTVADLLRGDFAAAWRDAGKVGSDAIDGWKRRIATFSDGARKAFDVLRGKSPTGKQAVETRGARALLRNFEGFRAKAYWDVNAYRVGYGSDTITDPKTGQVRRVQKGDTVTREMAEADLSRRLSTVSAPRAAAQVGDRWKTLPQGTKDALVSVAYNYGSLPKSVVTAAKTGDNAMIAEAVQALRVHNAGVNAGRRDTEAQLIRQAGQAQFTARAAAGAGVQAINDNRATQVNINGPINVVTQGRDAQAIARDLGPALKQHALVAQINTGLSG